MIVRVKMTNAECYCVVVAVQSHIVTFDHNFLHLLLTYIIYTSLLNWMGRYHNHASSAEEAVGHVCACGCGCACTFTATASGERAEASLRHRLVQIQMSWPRNALYNLRD